MQGTLRKMKTKLNEVVEYTLPVGDQLLLLNPLLNQHLELEFLGQIYCQNCGRKTNKSFSQGHCYPCMKSLAACDMCILKPEQCHFHKVSNVNYFQFSRQLLGRTMQRGIQGCIARVSIGCANC